MKSHLKCQKKQKVKYLIIILGLFLLSKEKFDNVEPYKKVNSKKIEQYTKEGIFIREWDSLNDAKDYFNLKLSSISNALTGRSSTANGFIWKYKL